MSQKDEPHSLPSSQTATSTLGLLRRRMMTRTNSPNAVVKLLNPTKEQAAQFALMLSAGMPSTDAIRYFFETDNNLEAMADRWVKSQEVAVAVRHQQNDRGWQELSLEERINLSVDKNYNEMAYFLYSHNYSELDGSLRQKADICRQALEARLAGTAGKMDALTRFWADVQTGKVILAGAAETAVKPSERMH